MNLAFADRDFYYGDPCFPPKEPARGLLSEEYPKARFATIDWTRNNPGVKPGDPYQFEGSKNPFAGLLEAGRLFPRQTHSAAADSRTRFCRCQTATIRFAIRSMQAQLPYRWQTKRAG